MCSLVVTAAPNNTSTAIEIFQETAGDRRYRNTANAARKKSTLKPSDRPATYDTASVWMGWRRKTAAAKAGNSTSEEPGCNSFRVIENTSKLLSKWIRTLVT